MQRRMEGSNWLTFGEAAEYAGVPLLELREALRTLSSPSQWGWRGGVAVQLVSLDDLEQLYPVLKQRKRKAGPSLAERGIQWVEPDAPGAPRVSASVQEKLQRAGRHLNPRQPSEPAPNEDQGGSTGHDPGTNRPSNLDPEVARLYAEMEAAAARNEALLEELSQAGQGLDQLLEGAELQARSKGSATPRSKRQRAARTTSLDVADPPVHPAEDALARSAEWNRLMHEQEAIESRQKRVQWISWAAAGLLVFLLAFKGPDWLGAPDEVQTPEVPGVDPMRGALASQGNRAGSGRETPRVAGLDRSADAQRLEVNLGEAIGPGDSSANGNLISFEEAVAAPNLVATQDWGAGLDGSAGEQGPTGGLPANPASASGQGLSGVPQEANFQRTGPGGVSNAGNATFDETVSVPGASSGASRSTADRSAQPDSEAESTESTFALGNRADPEAPPQDAAAQAETGQAQVAQAEVGQPASNQPPEYLPLKTSQAVPCQYAALTTKGQPLREVLGPCVGPWNVEKSLVSGSFRFAGYDLCRHHQTFQKELGGSVERASQVAQYAKQEGSIPPLVRLRVEHGASQLLQSKVGRWIESGFEAGLSKTHHIKPLKGEDQWQVDSWVRLQRKAAPGSESPQTELRHFRMVLQIDADRGRDRWMSFQWVEPPVQKPADAPKR